MTMPLRIHPIKVLIIDDHAIVRSGLEAIISDQADLQVVAEASNADEGLALVQKTLPDVVLVDLSLPDMDGIALITAMKRAVPDTRFVVLTTRTGSDDINRSLAAGAHAYLFKDTSGAELLSAIRMVADGGRYIPPPVGRKSEQLPRALEITARERQILLCLARGLSNERISESLQVSHETVKSHVKNILDKFGLENRSEAVAVGLKAGIIQIDKL